MDTLWQWQAQGGPVAVAVLAVFFTLGIIVTALWIALPFAVFGVKRLLRELGAAQRETNQRLAALEKVLGERALEEEPLDSL